MGIRVQIDGVGVVEFDDGFKTLSPIDQQAAVDEVANTHTASVAPAALGQPYNPSQATIAAAQAGLPLKQQTALSTTATKVARFKAGDAATAGLSQGALDVYRSVFDQPAAWLEKNIGQLPGPSAVATNAQDTGLAARLDQQMGTDLTPQIMRGVGEIAASAPFLPAYDLGAGLPAKMATGALQGGTTAALTNASNKRSLGEQISAGAIIGAAIPVVASAAKWVGNKLFVGGVSKSAFAAANDQGYFIPPSMASTEPSAASKALSAWGGDPKTGYLASVKNQPVTNAIAAQDIGLSAGAPITEDAINAVRAKAAQPASNIVAALPMITPDEEFKAAIGGLGKRSGQAAQYFPDVVKKAGIEELAKGINAADEFPPGAALELVQQLRADGVANLKSPGPPAQHALGIAQRQAADQVDALIERSLVENGKPELAIQYKAARELMAKTYDIEAVTNFDTGDVNALGLAKLANKGRPLSGGLETIAKIANNFPKAMRPAVTVSGMENSGSVDFFGALGSAATGHEGVAASLLGRPLVRNAILSRPYQSVLDVAAPLSTGPSLGLRASPSLAAVGLNLAQPQQQGY